jgi:hypothetical protein
MRTQRNSSKDAAGFCAYIPAPDLQNAIRCTGTSDQSRNVSVAPRQVFRLSVCLSHSWDDVMNTRMGRWEGRSHLQQSELFLYSAGSPNMGYMHRRS